MHERSSSAGRHPEPTYVETPPPAALASWVQRFWRIRGIAAESTPNRVLPDGCVDVIVDLSDVPRAFAVGPMQTADVIALHGRVDLFGVRFRPGAGRAAFDVSVDELRDRDVDLDVLWGPLAAELTDAMATAPLGDRVRHVERVLRRRFDPRCAPRVEEHVVARAVALMRRARGGAGVRDVAAALGVGERRLERAFARTVGLSPKFLARVERLQHALRLVDAASRPPARVAWTSIAYDAGYADQAHLVREFRALAGVTPAALAAERRRVGFVQYEDDVEQ